MKTYLVLPEVFLKYFTSADRGILDTIEKIYRRAEAGKIKLLLSEGLFFMLALELEKRVKERDDMVEYLESILNLHNLKIRNEMILRKTVLEMRKGKDFIEAYKSVVVPLLSLEDVIECKTG